MNYAAGTRADEETVKAKAEIDAGVCGFKTIAAITRREAE
jgi:hypothetical protein